MPIYSLAVLVVLALAITVSFHRFNYPCSKLSECILWVLSWYHVIHSMFLVVIATYHRRRLTALALTKGAALATGPGAPFKRPFVYFAVVFLARSAVVHASRVRGPESAAVVALYCLAVSVPVVLEALVVMFFSVAENAFQSLHEEAESLLVSRVQEKAIEKRDLERLAEAHWSACDYVDTVNATFGLDMIVCMTFNMARFVVFVYLAFVNLYALKLAFLHTLESGVALVLELLDVTFRVFYTCYKATKIQTPAKKTLKTLREFCNVGCRSKHYSDMVVQLLDQLKERKIKIVACNFLEINLSFIEGLVATAFTYLLIFVQYNSKIKARIISDSRNASVESAGNRTST